MYSDFKKFIVSHDIASGSDIMPCNKIYKSLTTNGL